MLERQNYRERRGVGTVVESYKEPVYVSYAVVWPNINTGITRVVSRLPWEKGMC